MMVEDAKQHEHHRILSSEVKHKVPRVHAFHHPKVAWYGKIQTWMAEHITLGLSTMEFFWFCALLDGVELVGLLNTHWSPVVIWVTFLSQTVIQLLALPAIGAQNRLAQVLSDQREIEQTRTLNAMLAMVKDLHDKQIEQLDHLVVIRNGHGKNERATADTT